MVSDTQIKDDALEEEVGAEEVVKRVKAVENNGDYMPRSQNWMCLLVKFISESNTIEK